MTVEQNQRSIQQFRDRVAKSQAVREKVRKLVRAGQWRQVEPNRNRFNAFTAARDARNILPRGAEAVQGSTADYQSVVFLPSGADIRRAIAFVEVTDPRTRSYSQGTGFMVSPSLFITNSHVIADEAAASATTITFDRENDARAFPRPTTQYRLDPAKFALFSPPEELDFALVAVGDRVAGDLDLPGLTFVALSNRPDKHVLGMNVNIIQHPLGWPKTLAIRNNLLVDRSKTTLLYETDTDVGSSGSPVFNDDWELVALHHWGHPFLEQHDDQGKPLPQNVNEGVRVSALHDFLQAKLDSKTLAPPQAALLAEVLAQAAQTAGAPSRVLGPPRPTGPGSESTTRPQPTELTIMSDSKSGEATLTIPLTISFRIGDGAVSVSAPRSVAAVAAAPPPSKVLQRGAEVLKVDQDYAKRKGYDPDFIPGEKVALPKPSDKLAGQVGQLRASEPDFEEGELKYEHFSLKLHKAKRIAIFTATNVDGETYLNVDRATGQVTDSEGDKWFIDPRVSGSFYLDQSFYNDWSTYFDRGHLTRRTDPTWGTAEDAERANADTFHFTNCSPQHFRFNESARYWQGVERYILENGVIAANTGKRLCVFQGPVWDSKLDLWADDVQIPSSFWKIVVWRGADRLKAVGLVVDQRALLSEPRKSLGAPSDLPSVNVTHWRVKIDDIEKRTKLDFGKAVRDADTIGQLAQPLVGGEAAKPVTDWKDLL